MRLCEVGHALKSGTWQAEFKVMPSDSFDPDGAYVGVQWVTKRTPPAQRNPSDVQSELAVYPGSGANSWGWKAAGGPTAFKLEGSDTCGPPESSWRPGDTLTLTLDTAKMTIQAGKKQSPGAESRAIGTAVQLPRAVSRAAAFHFCVGRYYGRYKVKLVAIRRLTAGSWLEGMPPLLTFPVGGAIAAGGASSGTKPPTLGHCFESPIECEPLYAEVAPDSSPVERHLETIILVRQLLRDAAAECHAEAGLEVVRGRAHEGDEVAQRGASLTDVEQAIRLSVERASRWHERRGPYHPTEP
jgi:hypothetical protein